MNRTPNRPFGCIETTRPTDRTNSIKTVVPIILAMAMSAFLGLMFARGL